jgi:XTP/dITP diphosphohydrolase
VSRLVVATRSEHKLDEIRDMLGDIPNLEVVDLIQAGVEQTAAEDEIEVHDTFAENALAKARYFAERTREAVLADDSGLCVDALRGAPGVRSKRFSGRSDLRGAGLDRANNSVLLARLIDVPTERRTAHFSCAVALVRPDGSTELFHGRCNGVILAEPRGVGGFGYDPLFLSDEIGVTFAEATPAEKNSVSHRARAVDAARGALREFAGRRSPEPPAA